jgi:hypothetical protein
MTVYRTQTIKILTFFSLISSICSPSKFLFLLLYYCCTEGTMWHLQKWLQYTLLNLSLLSFSFTHSPHYWNSFNRSHFSIFIYENIVFLPYPPSYNLSFYSYPSHWYQPPERTCFAFLFCFSLNFLPSVEKQIIVGKYI